MHSCKISLCFSVWKKHLDLLNFVAYGTKWLLPLNNQTLYNSDLFLKLVESRLSIQPAQQWICFSCHCMFYAVESVKLEYRALWELFFLTENQQKAMSAIIEFHTENDKQQRRWSTAKWSCLTGWVTVGSWPSHWKVNSLISQRYLHWHFSFKTLREKKWCVS